ncbi:MAG: hypothetical protein QM775_27815 [Pirellulales bacterium]
MNRNHPALPSQPSTTGAIGRFRPGNRFGCHRNRQASRFRAALLRIITPADITTVMRALVAKAKAGDLDAVRLLLDRTIGKPVAAVALNVNVASGVAIEFVNDWYDEPRGDA